MHARHHCFVIMVGAEQKKMGGHLKAAR